MAQLINSVFNFILINVNSHMRLVATILDPIVRDDAHHSSPNP